MNYATYSDDGGSTILAYSLEVDLGDGNGFVSVSDDLTNTQTISSGLTSG